MDGQKKTQWVKEDGKWQEKIIDSRPPLPSRTSTQTSQGLPLPARSNNSLSPAPPVLPFRPAKSPILPPRRPSEVSCTHSRRPSEVGPSRRGSNESTSSVATAETSLSAMSNGTSTTSRSERYAIRAPEYDPSSLPVLPPKKSKEEKEAEAKAVRRPYKSSNSTPSTSRKSEPTRPQPPPRPQTRPPLPTSGRGNLPVTEDPSESDAATVPRRVLPPPSDKPSGQPPVLPGRQVESSRSMKGLHAPTRAASHGELETPVLPKRTTAAPPLVKRSALSMGFGNLQQSQPSVPTVPALKGVPPPIPTASRPDLAALQASKPKANCVSGPASVPASTRCLHCRDFSGPDNHATRFPRESLPSTDIGWLSQQLTSPFPSVTDKARAIFTWLHHNILYDIVAFFNNSLKPSTPQSTLASGLAVCEGFAGLFVALALKAGLEAIVVVGNGKGFGYHALKPGDPIPPYSSGHAWNAVKIDGGEWKLVDPCWGAGACNGKGQPYLQRFAPQHFTKSNDDFGLSHFPEDSSKQYRNDGRIVSWEEYITGNKSGTAAQMFSGYIIEEGLSETSFKPVPSPLVLSQQGPTVRFSFQTVCPHWDPIRCGKGSYYVYVLHMEGLDGTDRNHVPFQQGDGVWWCDVPVGDLGRPGQKATICAVDTFDGKDARGVTIDEYRRRKGRVAMSFGFVAQWTMG